jgi:hypothetical protein
MSIPAQLPNARLSTPADTSHCVSVQIRAWRDLTEFLANTEAHDGALMPTFTSADAKNNFGELIDLARAALTRPVPQPPWDLASQC